MASHKCAYCSASLPILPASFTTVRCQRCGAVHHPDGEVISPRMLPITANRRASPWMFGSTRPVVPGLYYVRFNDLERSLVLRWTGWEFLDAQGKPVATRSLMSWRGDWE